jgi:chitin disaccharide deacetylase
MSRQLIVNADDYNTDEGRNRGILEAARRGIVTSTTVLANAALSEVALHGLQDTFGGRIGVHLNLTKGRPVSKMTDSLAGQDGCFFSKHGAWRRALAGVFDPGEVEREFCAQIEALQSVGIEPDHVDSNNHLHVFPGIAGAAARAAQRCGIRRIRLPREPLWWSLRQAERGVVKKIFISLLALRARAVLRHAGLCFPDRCAGLQMPDVRSEQALKRFLERLPAGSTELICHPGYADSHTAFSTADRERELAALTADTVRKAIKHNAVSLISFSDLPCV